MVKEKIFKYLCFSLGFICLSIVAMSCSIKQEFQINANRSGYSRMTLNLDSELIIALQKLRLHAEANRQQVDFDDTISRTELINGFETEIKKEVLSSLNQASGLSQVSFERIKLGVYMIKYQFSDMNLLAVESINQTHMPIVSFFKIQKKGKNQLFTLDFTNGLFFDFFTSSLNQNERDTVPLNLYALKTASRDDLKDLVDYFFMEDVPSIQRLLEQSTIDVYITFPRDIISYEGGTKLINTTMHYVIPLKDITVLDTLYSVLY